MRSSDSIRFAIMTLFIAFSAESLYASCGDWLANPAEPMDSHQAKETTTTASDHQDEALETSDNSAPIQDGTCDGPQCRRQPVMPFQQVKWDSAPQTSRACGSGLSQRVCHERTNSHRSLPDDADALAGYPNMIERPPQCMV